MSKAWENSLETYKALYHFENALRLFVYLIAKYKYETNWVNDYKIPFEDGGRSLALI